MGISSEYWAPSQHNMDYPNNNMSVIHYTLDLQPLIF